MRRLSFRRVKSSDVRLLAHLRIVLPCDRALAEKWAPLFDGRGKCGRIIVFESFRFRREKLGGITGKNVRRNEELWQIARFVI